jgi:alpha-tubulin suppressor-like RCC1 family protein
MWTWGYNGQGQVGDGTRVSRSSPVQVGALTNWSQIAAGNGHTAAVKTDGTLWAWGNNNNPNGGGQLGLNDVLFRSSPVQVGALTNWSQIAAGRLHTAAIKTDGTLWAWAQNIRGQVGDNTVVARSSPVQVGALTNWSQIAAGGYHTAAIKTDGTLWTWGYNANGQVGDGTAVSRSSPVQVGALTTWFMVAKGAGTRFTLALYGVV